MQENNKKFVAGNSLWLAVGVIVTAVAGYFGYDVQTILAALGMV